MAFVVNIMEMFIVVFAIALIRCSDGLQSSAVDNADMFTQLVDLQRRHVDSLLEHPDVTGVDINYKTVGGEHTDQLSLVIWVEEKLPEEELPEERKLPKHIEGFQTDIIQEEIPVATQVYGVYCLYV